MLKLPSHLLNKCTELNSSLVQGLHQTVQCDRRLTSCHCTTQCTLLDVLAVSASMLQVQTLIILRMPTCVCLALLYLDAKGELASMVLEVDACEHKRQLFPCNQSCSFCTNAVFLILQHFDVKSVRLSAYQALL